MGEILSKGANAPIAGAQVTVVVSAGTVVDLAALLVTANGKVRSDADFIFYNQPNGPGVQLQPPSTLQLSLPSLPLDIDKVVLTASLDGSGPATFGEAGRLSIAVRDGSADLASFTPDGLGPEKALILVEVYRRQGAWKVRAVGQGYAGGLAGIAADFGIAVDEPGEVAEPAPPAAAPPPPPAAPPPPPPQPQQAPPPAAPAPPAPPPAGAPINLDKGRVSLSKGQTVSLVKTGAPPLSRVRMGLGWDIGSGAKIDLDASCILYDAQKRDLDKVWWKSRQADNGNVRHCGDNLTGAGAGDDEVISVDLGRLSPDVHSLVFVVNSFTGQKFTAVENAFCRLVDANSKQELVRFDLSHGKRRTGLVMCKVQRGPDGWLMTAIGEFHDGKTVEAMVDHAKRYL